jgi:ribosomal protein L37AE/L43A
MPELAVTSRTMCDKATLLSVIRHMAEDMIRIQHPDRGCPAHGQGTMRRADNGIRYCIVAGCGYEATPGTEPTVSTIVDRYLEKVNAGQRC